MTSRYRSAAYLLLGLLFSIFLSVSVFSTPATAEDIVLPEDAVVNVTSR